MKEKKSPFRVCNSGHLHGLLGAVAWDIRARSAAPGANGIVVLHRQASAPPRVGSEPTVPPLPGRRERVLGSVAQARAPVAEP